MSINIPTLIPKTPRLNWGFERHNQEFDKANPEQIKVLKEALLNLEKGTSLREVKEFVKGKGYEVSIGALHKLWVKWFPDSPKLLALKRERDLKARWERKEASKQTKVVLKARKEALKKSRAIQGEKTRLRFAEKRLEKLVLESKEAKSKDETFQDAIAKPFVITTPTISEEAIKEAAPSRQVVFQPHPGPQTEFLEASEQEVLYGGAAGGGKSMALIADPIRYFDNPNFNGLLIRRTNDELRELIWSTKKIYTDVFNAKFGEKSSEWRFPKGGRLWISYLDRDEDVMRYQGQAFTWIGLDEVTQYPTPFAWDYLRSRLRTTDPKLKESLSMRGTTNPGGPGHGWVKKMFVDPSPSNVPFWATDIETGQILRDPETRLPLFQRRFIPAKLSDNPSLAEDGQYRKNLLSLPEARRAQLLEGDWTISDGAAFSEFRTSRHVIKPHTIPSSWTRFRAADYGYSSFSCVLWFAIDPLDEQLICYRELYVSKFTGEQLAYNVLNLERDEKVSYGVLDSSVWHKRGEGPSIAEVMINTGCRWKPSDRSQGSRVAGKNRLHELFKDHEVDGEGLERPGLVFFDNCRQIIGDLQSLPTDPNGLDDIDSRYKSDHSYDALRYGVMSRPRSNAWFLDPSATTTFSANQASDPKFGY